MSLEGYAPQEQEDSGSTDGSSTDRETFELPNGQQVTGVHATILRRAQAVNIAEELEESDLSLIATDVLDEYDIDQKSREKWLEKNREAMELAKQVAEKKTHPWTNASNVIYPLITTAAIQFAARAYPAIVVGRSIVKGVVVGNDSGVPVMGDDGSPVVPLDQQTGQPAMDPQTGQPQIQWQIQPGERRERADRIANHMSYQLLDEMDNWEEDTDTLLHVLPIVGCCFRKSYFDPGLGRNVSDYVSARNVVVNYWAKSLERAARISERISYYPSEIRERELAGVWREKEGGYGQAQPSQEEDDQDKEQKNDPSDPDAPHEFIEQHRRLDLDEDGYSEPYIVTVHRESRMVVRIVARYDADKVHVSDDGRVARIEAIQYYTKYDFIPNPDGGIYGLGFGELISPLNHSTNTVLNQLIDAGTLANTKSGFIGRGLSLHGGELKLKQGSFRPVNAPGSRVREAIVPIDFGEPSQVLFSLLGLLIEAGKDIGSVKDVLTGETAAASMAPTTLMGLIDQGLKVFTGIYKRVHRSLKRELDKLYRLNRIYMEKTSGFEVGGEWQEITQQDYVEGSGIKPISDPSMVSNLQKLSRAELLRTFVGDPHFDQVALRQRILDAADIPETEELLVKQQPDNPMMPLEIEKIQRESAKLRAQEVELYAQAIQNLAQADKASADGDIGWAKGQMDVLRMRMESVNGMPAQDPTPSGPASGEPPIEGARQAADGNWYVPDENRPGKYMMVA